MCSVSLWNQLEERKSHIVDRWFQMIINTYAEDTARFLGNEKDRFINSVGYTIRKESGAIFEELIHDMQIDKLTASLQEIIKIRAVQDFTSSDAIRFVFLLKHAVREVMPADLAMVKEQLDFEERVDKLALLAFDIYNECREKISEIRVKEITAQKEMALRMLSLANGTEELE